MTPTNGLTCIAEAARAVDDESKPRSVNAKLPRKKPSTYLRRCRKAEIGPVELDLVNGIVRAAPAHSCWWLEPGCV